MMHLVPLMVVAIKAQCRTYFNRKKWRHNFWY